MPQSATNQSEGAVLWTRTDPDEEITIAHATSIRDTRPTALKTTYRQFFSSVMEPDRSHNAKMGSLFMMGTCNGNKSKSNVPNLHIAVLDADSSYTEDMHIIDGAPDPVEVHKFFKGLDISHAIYTTFSHGKDGKGNRYRVIFPIYCYSEYQLRSAATYFSELLQKHAQLPFVLTPESFRWGSLWQYPRLRNDSSPFFSETYWGNSLNALEIERYYDFQNELSNRIPPSKELSRPADDFSLVGQMERYLPVTQQLKDAGYTFWHQGSQRMPDGRLQLVQRWAKPDEKDNPGIVVFMSSDREFAYSHYSNDPLSNGRANDSWSTFRALNGLESSSKNEVMRIVAEILEEIIADEMNSQYPSVLVSGTDFKIGNIFDEESGGQSYKYMTYTNFQMAMANQPPVWKTAVDEVEEGGEPKLKSHPRDVFWRTSKLRKLYNGLRYEPCKLGEKPDREIVVNKKLYFNLFRGWPFDPKPGKWDFLSWHLMYSICSGNEVEYEYLLDWFAHTAQQPTQKPGVALVLKGGKGWGKTEVFSRLIKAFGPNAMVVPHSKQLTGNFNSHLQNKIALLVEESFWSGDPQAEGPLKNIITDKHTTYEAKRENAVEGKSMLRVVMSTNNDWAAPVSEDERRFFIPTMSNASLERNQTRKTNPRGDFFPYLFMEMDNGGVAAFYYDMLQRDIAGRSIHSPPLTTELTKQRKHSMHKEEAWIFDLLSTGEIRMRDKAPTYLSDAGTTVKVSDLEDSVRAYLSNHDKSKSSFHRLRNYLLKYLPNSHRLINSGSGTYVRFSSLQVCRDDYQRQSKVQVDWPEIDTTFSI